jgi:hypothetical protein
MQHLAHARPSAARNPSTHGCSMRRMAVHRTLATRSRLQHEAYGSAQDFGHALKPSRVPCSMHL